MEEEKNYGGECAVWPVFIVVPQSFDDDEEVFLHGSSSSHAGWIRETE